MLFMMMIQILCWCVELFRTFERNIQGELKIGTKEFYKNEWDNLGSLISTAIVDVVYRITWSIGVTRAWNKRNIHVMFHRSFTMCFCSSLRPIDNKFPGWACWVYVIMDGDANVTDWTEFVKWDSLMPGTGQCQAAVMPTVTCLMCMHVCVRVWMVVRTLYVWWKLA